MGRVWAWDVGRITKEGWSPLGWQSGEETSFKDKSAPWEVRSTLWQNSVEEEIL